MTVKLFTAFEFANRILFSASLDVECGRFENWWHDDIAQTRDEEDEPTPVDVLHVEISEDGDYWRFENQDITIDEQGYAEVRTFKENPEEAEHSCCFQFLLTSPMSEQHVRQQLAWKLITPKPI